MHGVCSRATDIAAGAISHWPALQRWTEDYLRAAAGDALVTVALTPNGRADALTPLSPPGGASDAQCCCFALPYQQRMTLADFLALLHSSRQQLQDSLQAATGAGSGAAPRGGGGGGGGGVPYLQFQNSSLTAELPQLLGDVDPELGWASEAFGEAGWAWVGGDWGRWPQCPGAARQMPSVHCLCQAHNPRLRHRYWYLCCNSTAPWYCAWYCAGGGPEAVNLWVGDERSVTTWHSDPFENLYAVVAGSKTFSLLPPADAYRMALRTHPTAVYQPVATAAAAPGCSDDSSSGSSSSSSRCGVGGEPESTFDGAGGGAALQLRLLHPPQLVRWSSVQPEHGTLEASTAALAGLLLQSQQPQPPQQPRQPQRGPGSGGEGPDLFSDPSLPPPLRVTVRAGEVLYLPALWWHQASVFRSGGSALGPISPPVSSGTAGRCRAECPTTAAALWLSAGGAAARRRHGPHGRGQLLA